ncbi:MAG: efflux RND transporter periplasmic adaptor subunit [Candidatus Humimicrobiaceae bacterium]
MGLTVILKKSSKYSKIISALLIIILCISTVFIISCKKNNAYAAETIAVVRGDIIQSVDVSGNVEAGQLKNLSLPASGKVLKSVEKGDFLKKGDVLIEIDNRKTKLVISQAQENIKVAEIALKVARINYKSALDANHVAIQIAKENNKLAEQATWNAFNNLENTNGVGSASIESARTALANAQNSYNASINQAQTALDEANYQLKIAKDNSVTNVALSQYEAAAANSQASYNTAVTTATSSLNSAAAAVASSEAQAQLSSESAEGAYAQALINQSVTYWNTVSSLEQAEKQISATIENISTTQVQVNLAKINLDIAGIELENSVILMPFDGLVQNVNFKEGEYLSPSLAAVTVISNDFVIKTDIEETDIGKIKKGQDVDIILDAYPDEKIKGIVDKISPISKNTAGVISFQVTILPKDVKPDLLLPGISANATIYISKIENVILVPSLAVFEENGKSIVWISNEKNEPVLKEVKTGATDFENTEIISGINEGDKVFLSKPNQSNSPISFMNNN